MTATEAVARARSAAGKKTIYKLSKGGMNAKAALPVDAQSECDCSGFACWILGVSRWSRAPLHPWPDFPADWISTDSIYHDAKATQKRFRVVLDPAPGDLIVYPDHAGGQGHVGMIGDVGDGGPVSVIHCSAGNMRQYGDAIHETPLASFWANRGAIYARPTMYDAQHPQDEGMA